MENEKCLHVLVTMLFFYSCQPEKTGISTQEFKTLMNSIATGWSTQNTDLALSSFDENAIYMEPPNVQYYQGHAQLRPYFDALEARHNMQFHHIWFDETTQIGVGEFTFSYGKPTADVGIAVIELKNGKIKFWREYLQKGPTEFKEFIGIENKDWEWHIGNYPEPKDTLPAN